MSLRPTAILTVLLLLLCSAAHSQEHKAAKRVLSRHSYRAGVLRRRQSPYCHRNRESTGNAGHRTSNGHRRNRSQAPSNLEISGREDRLR
jgi:hypothetical protein